MLARVQHCLQESLLEVLWSMCSQWHSSHGKDTPMFINQNGTVWLGTARISRHLTDNGQLKRHLLI